jgi:hypothetical protein
VQAIEQARDLDAWGSFRFVILAIIESDEMNLSKSIYIAVAALLLNACSSKIEGEAFVVTKGGESKKLGLVEVQAYKMSDMDGFKKKLLSEYSGFIDKIAEDYKFVGLKEKHDERNKLITEINEANIKYKKCTRPYAYLDITECEAKLPKELAAEFELRRTSIAVGTMAIIADKAMTLDNKFDLIYLVSRVAEHTKSLEAIKTKTDADGKFAMTLPSGEYLIAAVGSRQSLGEDYFWLLHTNKSGAIRLANDSMFDQGCDTCLFTKDDIGKLNDKKNKIETFLSGGGGSLMLHYAKSGAVGIYGDFWRVMCGDIYSSYKDQGKKVFEWAECVK